MKHGKPTMSDYYNAGFETLLPIIPPHAQISPLSKALVGREDMLGKVPGLLRDDGWVGFSKWSTYDTDENDIDRWDQWDCGIGIRCRDVIAVDIDVTDPSISRLIMGMVLTHLGFGPVRTGLAPKRLVLFKAEFAGALPTKITLPFNDWNGTHHVVEILGNKQQFVLQGIHPKSEKPYSWDTSPVEMGLDGLDIITAVDIDTFLAEVASLLEMLDCTVNPVTYGSGVDAKPMESLCTHDVQLLRDAVKAIPNTDDTTREEFVAMAHAVKSASFGDTALKEAGRDAFCEWAYSRPAGQKEGEPERVFDSVMCAGIGIQWLLAEAKKFGFDASSADFNIPVEDSNEPALEVADKWTPGSDSFWDRFVYINQVKRFVDIKSDEFLDKEQFNDLNRDGGKDKPADLFLDSRRPHSFVSKMDYIPGESAKVLRQPSGILVYNRWVPGPGQKPVSKTPVTEADVAPWLALGQHLFPDAGQLNILIDWCSSLLQRPGVKPNWHPLVGSEVHGSGKDSFFQPLIQGLGDNTSTIRMNSVDGDFSWWAECVELVVVSEIHSIERKAVINKLKSYMAAPPFTIDINKKNIPQYEVPNLFGILMFTNNQDAVALEKHDRRFYIAWSEAGLLPESVYEQYHQWLLEGGIEKVCQYMLQRDISHFSSKGNAPATAAKDNMRKAALPGLESTVEYAIEHRDGPFEIDLFTLSDVDVWLRNKGFRSIGPHRLATVLKSAGCVCLDRARMASGGSKVGIWCCNRFDMYSAVAVKGTGKTLVALMEKQRLELSMDEFEGVDTAGHKKGR